MLKVLSTKLKADDVDRFEVIAEQQGKTKSKLLRCVVQGYLSSSSGEVVKTASIDGSLQTTSSEKRGPLEKTNDVDSPTLNQNPTSKDNIPFYYTDTKGRLETLPKSSISIWWPLVLVLLALSARPQPSTAVDRDSTYTTQSPQVDTNGLYAHKVGNAIVYSSSSIPFW